MAKEPHQQHKIRPEDVAVFIELDGFTDAWRDLRLSDGDLHALQLAIMAKPKGAPVVSGTGRLRKIRYAPSRSGKGKAALLVFAMSILRSTRSFCWCSLIRKTKRTTSRTSKRRRSRN
jgi:hypothetical protein